MAVLLKTFLLTPLGPMLAVASGSGLCGLGFDRPERATRLWKRLAHWRDAEPVQDGEAPVFETARAWLRLYFESAASATLDVPLDLLGTGFELAVWKTLQAIPPGQTTSYGAIAASLGRPDAARAVGAAVGANPVGLIVPCHRVVGSSGALTGYGGGLDRKEWLLRHEGARGVAGDLFISPFENSPRP
jgi:methylated-DNA-[protein]-cysteine S-methyltransferase